MDKLTEANQIADEGRNVISPYCMNVCKALCCRKGFLTVKTQPEIDAVTHGKEKELRKEGMMKDTAVGTLIDMEKKDGCPSLERDTWKCTIYKNPHRPRVCSDFPLFFMKGYISAASYCPAVKEGLLEEYIEKIEKLGFKRV